MLLTFGLSALVAPLALLAQQPVDVPRVGLLALSGGTVTVQIEALRAELRVRGYVEGKNINLDSRFLVKRYEDLPRAAEQLVSEKVAVILAIGDTATDAASRATTTIPIVGSTSRDPVAKGLALSLSRPGKNVTGIISMSAEVTDKRLALLKEAVPALRRVAILLNPASAGEVAVLQNLDGAARRLNLDLRPVEVRTERDFDMAAAEIAKTGAGALLAISSSMFTANRELLVKTVAKTRLPAIYAVDSIAESGGLMSYGLNSSELSRMRALFVDRILKGARPGDIPFEQITRLELVVNLKTARALGLTFPPSILLRADRVIE